jgi:ABC-type antimicrobial peptide transport system permease subunit
MAQGAVLTTQGLRARNDAAINAVAFVDFETGADELAAAERARQILGDAIGLSPDAIRAYSALRPAELVDIESATTTVFVLTGVLLAAAAIALALTLSGSVRRRRHQLAVLAALGFSRRDLRRTIRWQTAGIMVIAVAIGVPIGVIMARVGWSLFARQIGVVTTPVVPIAGVIAIAVTVLIAAIVAGERPARNAASTRTAAALTRSAEATG